MAFTFLKPAAKKVAAKKVAAKKPAAKPAAKKPAANGAQQTETREARPKSPAAKKPAANPGQQVVESRKNRPQSPQKEEAKQQKPRPDSKKKVAQEVEGKPQTPTVKKQRPTEPKPARQKPEGETTAKDETTKPKKPATPDVVPAPETPKSKPVQPLQFKPKTPKQMEAELLHATKPNQGKCIHILVETLAQGLFKCGLTLEAKETHWAENTTEPETLNRTRRDVVHALLGATSLNYFVRQGMNPPAFVCDMSTFPYVQFIESVCAVSTNYLQKV